ncbi:uncharacterized protein [Aegilops tauschii subsp. strangulata]|uniref:uncharacterized protein n=1 Tax=Aegilops tauschii subsp. strangulata TaxID=200361 RepID=UPI003CC8699E
MLQVPYDQLAPTKPFSGVTRGSANPLGQVRLPVTFSTRDHYRTELIDFDVARIDLPYNAILGYPALAKFMAAAHPGYNVIKMPGSGGIISVAGDTRDAVRVLKIMFKAVAALRPSTRDASKAPEAAPVKKKQLFSQDQAKTKQVPVDDGGLGPTVTIGTGLPSEQEEELIGFLWGNKDVFAWEASDLVGVPRDVIEHHLMVCPNAHPVKQKARWQAQEKQTFIVQEVRKLQGAGVILEVRHPDWLPNPVIVPKKGGSRCQNR